jgi:urea transport system permease protein
MWILVLGALFVCVTLFLPKGIVGTLADWIAKRPRYDKKPVPAAARTAAAEPAE